MSFASIPTSSGDSVKPADLANHLLIIEPLEYRTGITTTLGVSDAISVNVHDLDTKETHSDVLLFNPGLRGPLSKLIGQKALARIVQGVSSKPGHTAPWILQDANGNAADVERATAFLASGFAPANPAPAAALAGVDLSDPGIQALLAKLGATQA